MAERPDERSRNNRTARIVLDVPARTTTGRAVRSVCDSHARRCVRLVWARQLTPEVLRTCEYDEYSLIDRMPSNMIWGLCHIWQCGKTHHLLLPPAGSIFRCRFWVAFLSISMDDRNIGNIPLNFVMMNRQSICILSGLVIDISRITKSKQTSTMVQHVVSRHDAQKHRNAARREAQIFQKCCLRISTTQKQSHRCGWLFVCVRLRAHAYCNGSRTKLKIADTQHAHAFVFISFSLCLYLYLSLSFSCTLCVSLWIVRVLVSPVLAFLLARAFECLCLVC